jgi:hypothetical protein
LLRVLATQRSPDSYNREGPRYSGDIDIFQDTEERLEAAALAQADEPDFSKEQDRFLAD